ncbi:sensor histidine kinase [Alkaliphilus transvaalensis]|uniref:sensor histidine kinase n=1 Tax=Alkaliphilus transvaalensis TaxID=114628 RepID=UPI00068795A3|nr:sensor histidine kinase [Alkaliphilus transvaalensis]
MLSRYLRHGQFSDSIQWVILEKIFIVSIFSSSLTLLTLWLLPLEMGNYKSLFIILLVIFSSFLFTFLIGLPFGRNLKYELQSIQEAHEAIGRGRIDLRLMDGSYTEVKQINNQFNIMVDYIQKQVESLQRLVNENKMLLKNAEETASIDERKKIARELHDAVSQQLFAISITLGAIRNLIDSKPEEAKKYFQRVEEMVHTAQQELRALIMHLRPVNLDGINFTDGLVKLLKELDEKNPNVTIRWDIEDLINLSEGIEDNLFRVLQEGISNVLRHSKATSLIITLFNRNNLLSINIEDNGVGFNLNEDKIASYGIKSMQERIADIGGRFEIYSYPNKGTRLEIRVPI